MEYLKNNIINILIPIFKLSNIDWLLCDKIGSKNLVKEVADYYMEYKPISTREISSVFNISSVTIQSYLSKSATHGWCDYTVESAQELRNQTLINNNINRNSKTIYVYKNDIRIGHYPSVSILSKKVLKILEYILATVEFVTLLVIIVFIKDTRLNTSLNIFMN